MELETFFDEVQLEAKQNDCPSQVEAIFVDGVIHDKNKMKFFSSRKTHLKIFSDQS